MNEARSNRYSLRWTSITIVAIIVVATLVLSAVTIRPKPMIVGLSLQRVSEFGWLYQVEVDVKNNGVDGNVIVYCEIEGEGHYEKQNEETHLETGETKQLHFDFHLIEVELNNITYTAWAVAN